MVDGGWWMVEWKDEALWKGWEGVRRVGRGEKKQ